MSVTVADGRMLKFFHLGSLSTSCIHLYIVDLLTPKSSAAAVLLMNTGFVIMCSGFMTVLSRIGKLCKLDIYFTSCRYFCISWLALISKKIYFAFTIRAAAILSIK